MLAVERWRLVEFSDFWPGLSKNCRRIIAMDPGLRILVNAWGAGILFVPGFTLFCHLLRKSFLFLISYNHKEPMTTLFLLEA